MIFSPTPPYYRYICSIVVVSEVTEAKLRLGFWCPHDIVSQIELLIIGSIKII